MAAPGKKKNKKSSKQRQNRRNWLVFLAVAAIFVVVSGLVAFMVFRPKGQNVVPKTETAAGHGPVIHYEEAAEGVADPVIIEGKGEKHVTDRRKNLAGADRPSVAIVIDDMGYNQRVCEDLIDLDLNLSFAFLPFGPHTAAQADKANRLGRDILLHFPMEASDQKWKPGPGTVTIAMAAPEIRGIFNDNLAAVPYAVGINNHMGSRFTQNNRAMRHFMELMQETGLFFLDSRTSRNSVGYSLAKEMGLTAGKRDVFLDNIRDRKKIIVQLGKLLEVARRKGSAIAIGHPYPETLAALREFRKEIASGFEVVGVGTLVR